MGPLDILNVGQRYIENPPSRTIRALLYPSELSTTIWIHVPVEVDDNGSLPLRSLYLVDWIPEHIKLITFAMGDLEFLSIYAHAKADALESNQCISWLTQGEYCVKGDVVVVMHRSPAADLVDMRNDDRRLVDAAVESAANRARFMSLYGVPSQSR
ncbi:hypothetical protein EXIGLDRAFT_776524 [Exidia glandulosa HHB12029]|uniref:Uncharacterized protein n=1 Tax=Exidia glandulosa HHB12029 TaxID=1314781 RepID=A0A165DFY0_EXIGL|nr:hypothetical protein EXIGLDRAFT_776524 [Exidia glandulosa HHB12029]